MFKKIILLSVFFVSIACAASGSGVFVNVGVSRGAIKGDDMDSLYFFNGEPIESMPRVAPAFKLGYEISFVKPISLRAGVGLQFVGAGYEAEGISGITQPDINIHMENTYLTLPVELKLLVPIKRSGLYATVGPQFGFLLSAKTIDNENDTNVKNNATKVFNMGLGFRAGFEIAIAKHHLYFESGYDFGLSEVYTTSLEAKTGTLTLISAGFRINTSSIE